MADETTLKELIEYYSNLLIVQYNNLPKAKNTIELFVKELLSNGLVFDVRDAFNVNTAVGKQLDILGKYVGVDRFFKGQIFETPFLSFLLYEENPASISEIRKGFSNYTDFDSKDGRFLQYQNVLSTTQRLNDDEYRILIKFKIIQNNSNHSHKSIDDSLAMFFGTSVYAESIGNMIMTYFIPSNYSELVGVMIDKSVIPRPMGVGFQYIIKKKNSFFGFATYDKINELIKGFSTYDDEKEGEMLNYNKLLEV